jgi:hypothetical protein
MRSLRFYFGFDRNINILSVVRQKQPRKPAELRTQFHWLLLPFGLWGQQTKASRGVWVRKSTDMLYASTLRVFGIRGYLKERNPNA